MAAGFAYSILLPWIGFFNADASATHRKSSFIAKPRDPKVKKKLERGQSPSFDFHPPYGGYGFSGCCWVEARSGRFG